MPRWIFVLLLAPAVFVSALAPGRVSWATDYLSAANDLPLAQGLKEQVDQSTVFETPLGSIINAYAAGNLAPSAVLDFYDETLPQLGWEKQSSGTYRRKQQILKIDVWGPDQGPVKVSFTLSSQKP